MIQGITNFRDFGGLSSRFGGTIKKDRLYRSGSFRRTPDEAIEKLLDLDFALIADLRYAGEREHEPSPWPLTYAARVMAHSGAQDKEAPHMEPIRKGTMDEATAERIYREFYRDVPFDPLYQPLFAKIINALIDLDGRALIHCSAGKDRTGCVVALIHHALGVPRDAIMANYMQSREASNLPALAPVMAENMKKRFGVTIPLQLMTKLLNVEEQYLDAFFKSIEEQSGSIDAYLDSAGLTEKRRELLRQKYLS